MKKDYSYDEYHLSFKKISGKNIKDIVGNISEEFGDPAFKIYAIIFEDGTIFYVEGEHNCPYITVDEETDKIINAINEEENIWKN